VIWNWVKLIMPARYDEGVALFAGRAEDSLRPFFSRVPRPTSQERMETYPTSTIFEAYSRFQSGGGSRLLQSSGNDGARLRKAAQILDGAEDGANSRRGIGGHGPPPRAIAVILSNKLVEGLIAQRLAIFVQRPHAPSRLTADNEEDATGCANMREHLFSR